MRQRILFAGAAGIVAPFFVFALIFGAIASWPSFSWVNNALSDLGVQWGITANLFNSGLIVGGVLFIFFASGLYKLWGKSLVGKIGSGLFCLACVALLGIGVFNESFSPTHYIVSVLFFVALPISLLAFVATLWRANQHKLSILTLMLSLVAAAPWILEFTNHYVPNVAIPETISGLAGASWAITLSYYMLRKTKNTEASRSLEEKTS